MRTHQAMTGCRHEAGDVGECKKGNQKQHFINQLKI